MLALSLAALLFAPARGQYYMYQPGTSILPYLSSRFDTYGAGVQCNVPPSGVCTESPNLDPNMCQYSPTTVSTTPYIKVNEPLSTTQSSSFYAAPGASGSIYVYCGDWDFTYTVYRKLFVTLDGTLPDIFGTPVSKGYGTRGTTVNYSPGVVPFVVARCIEDNRTASRIAYAQRIAWDLTANGSWCPSNAINSLPTPRYHDLALPMCNPTIMGAACDGQSIVNMPTLIPSSSMVNPTSAMPTGSAATTTSPSSLKPSATPSAAVVPLTNGGSADAVALEYAIGCGLLFFIILTIWSCK
jgi:hypothetical protein